MLKNFISKLLKRPNPLLNNLTSGKAFDKKFNDIGVFQYTDEGFIIKSENLFKESQ
jgi:hypothetical protein